MGGEERAVAGALVKQFLVPAGGLHAPVREYDDLVDIADGVEPVGDDDRRTAHDEMGERFLDTGLGLRIDGGDRLVEDEDGGVWLEQPERMLEFLCAIGLSLEDALQARSRFLTDVFAYVLLIDYRYDRGGETVRAASQHPAPGPWLAAQPELDLPYARAAAELPTRSSDEQFERFVDDALTLIAARLPETDERPGKP